MADYAFFTMLMWVVKVVLILLAIVGLNLLAWWVAVSVHNRRARRALIAFSCVMLACAVIIAVLVQGYQSPSRIVQRSAAIPLSNGITVLHSDQHTGLDSSEIWLYFRMSPKDFDTILSSGTYTKLPYRNLNFDAYSPRRGGTSIVSVTALFISVNQAQLWDTTILERISSSTQERLRHCS